MRIAMALIAVSLLAACGDSAAPELPLLPSSALPGLESTTQAVDAADLAADFGPGDRSFSGFVRGRERDFHGDSHDLGEVVSRTLEFEDALSAEAYARYYRTHVVLAWGSGTSTSPIESEGRAGYLIDPAACPCHGAEPTLAALLTEGARVTYLEVNGGGAKRDRLEALLAQAP
jgi:hypothetical protein